MKDVDDMLWSRFQSNRSEVMVIIETLKKTRKHNSKYSRIYKRENR